MFYFHFRASVRNKKRKLSHYFGLLWFIGLSFFSALALSQNETLEAEIEDESSERLLEIGRELSARQLAIEGIQKELGIYDASLIEAYTDLAAFYFELEDYESASRMYTDALQVARINTGLYSHEQIPILESLIENSDREKEWQSVDDLQELYYLINSRLYSPADPQYLKVVESYGKWKLRIVQENLLDKTNLGLLTTAEDLSMFFGRVVDQFELQPDVKYEHLLNVIYIKTQTDMSLARSVAATPYNAFQGSERQYINQTRCRNVRNSAGQVTRQCYTVQVENPRYRQSQRDAKQYALARHTREVSRSISRLEEIKNSSEGLSLSEKRQIENQIVELIRGSEQLVRASRRSYLL